MGRFLPSFVLILTITGCAANHKTRAVQLVMASDAVADEIASAWEAGVSAQIEQCKSTLGDASTKEQRENCMGIFSQGEALEAATQTLISAQTVIKESVKCEELKSCPQKVNWQELKDAALSAWSALTPYYNAIVKKGK